MSAEGEIARLLRAVSDADYADAPIDNATLADALHLSLMSVAGCLQEAKARSFVGGTTTTRQPSPWYTNVELTPQGRRFLSTYVEREL